MQMDGERDKYYMRMAIEQARAAMDGWRGKFQIWLVSLVQYGMLYS